MLKYLLIPQSVATTVISVQSEANCSLTNIDLQNIFGKSVTTTSNGQTYYLTKNLFRDIIE